jgi:hypothetical protein
MRPKGPARRGTIDSTAHPDGGPAWMPAQSLGFDAMLSDRVGTIADRVERVAR